MYKHGASIGKIENGEVDLSQSRIKAFADALQTTPEYLMGYIDDPSPALSDIDILNDATNKRFKLGEELSKIMRSYGFNNEDIDTLKDYYTLTNKQKHLVIRLVDELYKINQEE